MKTMTVVLYSNSGDKINEIENIDRVTVFDNYIRVHYRDGDKIRILETNLPFIYYDGVKNEEN